jgi:hypothetical protein
MRTETRERPKILSKIENWRGALHERATQTEQKARNECGIRERPGSRNTEEAVRKTFAGSWTENKTKNKLHAKIQNRASERRNQRRKTSQHLHGIRVGKKRRTRNLALLSLKEATSELGRKNELQKPKPKNARAAADHEAEKLTSGERKIECDKNRSGGNSAQDQKQK